MPDELGSNSDGHSKYKPREKNTMYVAFAGKSQDASNRQLAYLVYMRHVG